SPADMTKPTEIVQMVGLGEGTFGSVDILVNNAGIQFVSPIEEFPMQKWDAIIAINLSSAFHGIRAAVPGMKKRKRGRIINTASAHSLVASPFKAAYVSAKHGIAGLTTTVALELATFNVSCNCISPGYVWPPPFFSRIAAVGQRGHGALRLCPPYAPSRTCDARRFPNASTWKPRRRMIQNSSTVSNTSAIVVEAAAP